MEEIEDISKKSSTPLKKRASEPATIWLGEWTVASSPFYEEAHYWCWSVEVAPVDREIQGWDGLTKQQISVQGPCVFRSKKQ